MPEMSYVFPATQDLLRSLELAVTDTSLGIVLGEYLSRVAGNGNEIEDSRPWQPGDSLANLDWRRELRTGEDYVYTYYEDLARPAQLIVDCGLTMNFGSKVRKAEYALVAAATFGFKLAEHKNPLSAQIHRGEEIDFESPGIGQLHAHIVLDTVLRAVQAHRQTGTTSLSSSLEKALSDLVQPGLAVVISDFFGKDDWKEQMNVLSVRHQVIAIQVVDPIELEMPRHKGTVQSVTTGQQVFVSRSGRIKRNKLAIGRHDDIADDLRDIGVDHLVLRTDEPWDAQIYEFVATRQHMMKGA